MTDAIKPEKDCDMSPRKHFLYVKIFAWVVFAVSCVVTIWLLWALSRFETMTMITLIFLTFLTLIVFNVLVNSTKAKCEKCSSNMKEIILGTYKYECPKCGWIYDTGEVCSKDNDEIC